MSSLDDSEAAVVVSSEKPPPAAPTGDSQKKPVHVKKMQQVAPPTADDDNLESVKYGDVIYLSGASKLEGGDMGFVYADPCFGKVGFLKEEMSGTELSNFQSCLFVILPQLNYESSSTRKELRRRSSFSGDASAEMEMVEIRMEQERIQNEAIVERCKKCDESVLYGQVVQLKHLATGKYLMGHRFTSQCQRDCLALSVGQGEELCHFRITPRFRVRQEGSPVYYADQIQLLNERLDGYAVHTTHERYLDESDVEGMKEIGDHSTIYELNLSSVKTSMKIRKFSRFDSLDPNALTSSKTLVRFFHPESESFLSASCSFTKKNPLAYLRKIPSDTNPSSNECMSAKAIFVFEYQTRMRGGAVKWQSKIRIKHVPTDRYLAVDSEAEKGNYHCKFMKEGDVSKERTLFSLVPTDEQGNTVPEARVSMRLEHTVKLASGEERVVHFSSIPKKSTSFGVHGVSANENRECVFVEDRQDNDAVLLMPVDPGTDADFIHKLQRALSMVPYTRWFTNRIIKLGNTPDGLKWSDIESMEALLIDLVKSCGEFSGKVDKKFEVLTLEEAKAPESKEQSSTMFQTIARDIKLMDSLFGLVSAPTQVQSSGNAANGLDMSWDDKHRRFKDPQFDKIGVITILGWKCLRTLFQSNRKSERYFAHQKGWINPGIIKQIPYKVGAARAFEKLISDNVTLLEQEVDKSIIAAFINLIKNHGPEDRLMQFFAAICTCQGNPIKSNQEACLNLLFLQKYNYDNMFVHTFEDVDAPGVNFKLSKFSTSFPENYLGKKQAQGGGFKPIMVSWANMKSMKAKVNGGNLLEQDFRINGKQECEISTFCKFVSKTSSEIDHLCGDYDSDEEDEEEEKSKKRGGRARGMTVMSERQSIMLQYELSLYYIAQIKVYANMCQGRSYNCITHLSKAFPYTMLINLISNESLDFEVRNAFCMLLKNLWVDRYPHANNCGRPSLPNLVWVYNDLRRTDVDDEGALLHFELENGHPCLEMDPSNENHEFLSMKSHTKFFLLRDFIVGFLDGLNGVQTIGNKSKNDMVLIVLKLAADLMSFGFFSTRAKIRELCEPLLSVLDGRADLTVEMKKNLQYFKDELKASSASNDHQGRGPSASLFMAERGSEDIEMIDNPLTAGSDKAHHRSTSFASGRLPSENQYGGVCRPNVAGVDALALCKEGKATEEYLELLVRREIGTKRYSMDSDNVRIMNCKMNMLRILGSVANLRVNHRLGDLILSFKEFLENGKRILDEEKGVTDEFFDRFETLFTKPQGDTDYDGTKLDMNSFSLTPLDVVCVDLMLYESDSLFENSLSFISRRFGQRKALLKFFPQVSLLIDQTLPVFGSFRRLDLDLQQLRYYVRSYNIWGVKTPATDMDEETRKRTNAILNKLVRFIYSPSQGIENDDTEDAQARRMSSHKRSSSLWAAKQKSGFGSSLRNFGFSSSRNMNLPEESSPKFSKPTRRVSIADLKEDDYTKSDEYVFQLDKNLPPSAVLGGYDEDVNANPLHQDILRNMGMAREVLFHALGIDYCIMEKVLDEEDKANPKFSVHLKDSRDWLYEILRKTIFVLSAFADGSGKNQQVLFTKLDTFRARLGDKVAGEDSEESLFCWDVVISMFQGNEKLVRVCPEQLLHQYSTLLAESDVVQNRCRLLDFFINICCPSNEAKAIVRNQDLCMKYLLGSGDLYGRPLLRLRLDSKTDNSNFGAADALEVAKSLQALAYCSKDKNNLAVAKSQAQVPIDEICDMYKMDCNAERDATENQKLYYKSCIMDFLTYCYVDTPLRDKDLERKRRFWEILEDAAKIVKAGWEGSHWSCKAESEYDREKYCKSFLSLAVSFFAQKNSILGDIGVWLQPEKVHFTNKTWKAVNDCCDVIRSSEGDTDYVQTRASKDAIMDLAQHILDDFDLAGNPTANTHAFRPGRKGRAQTDINEQAEKERKDRRAAMTIEERMRSGSTKEEKQGYLLQVANALANSEKAVKVVNQRDLDFIETLEQMEQLTDPEEEEYVKLATNFTESHREEDDGIMSEDEDEEEDEEEGGKDAGQRASESTRGSSSTGRSSIMRASENGGDAAAEDTKLTKKKKKKKKKRGLQAWLKRRKQTLFFACSKFLKVSEGMPMICWVLVLVAFATVSTLYQMATSDVQLLIEMEFVISMYFVVEILTKIFSFLVVDGDIDNFVFNKLNMIDFFVVLLDVLLLVAEGQGEESGAGGLLKSLRSLRVVRLVRMTRGMRALNLLKALSNTDRAEKIKIAKADSRSVKIKFDMVAGRFLRYVKDNSGKEMNTVKEETLLRVLDILVKYLTKYRERAEVKEDDRSDEEKGDPNDDEGIILWEDEMKKRHEVLRVKQTAFLENDAPAVIVYVVASTLSPKVLEKTFELGTELLSGGNEDIQRKFLEVLKFHDSDGIFFGVVRRTLRESAQALKLYRLSKEGMKTGNQARRLEAEGGGGAEVIDQHVVAQMEEIKKSNAMLNFLTQLCEGHNLESQNLLREQEKNVQSFNIVEEVCDLLGQQAKNLQVCRDFDDCQAECTVASMEFLVEVCQGPCAMNQNLVCSNQKAVSVCKNLLTCNFKDNILKDPVKKYSLYSQSAMLIASLLENREDDFCHKYLCEQIPQKMLEQRMGIIEKMKNNLKREELVRGKEKRNHDIKAGLQLIPGGKAVGDLVIGENAGKVGASSKRKGKFAKYEDDTIADLFDVLDDEARALLAVKQELAFAMIMGGKEVDMTLLKQLEERKMVSVEINWNGKTVKAYFNLPTEHADLSEVAKKEFVNTIDLSSSEGRMKALIEHTDELRDGMKFRHRLSAFWLYSLMREFYSPAKMIIFFLVVLLNFNVLWSSFDDDEDVLGKAKFQEDSVKITNLLSMMVLIGYSIIILYVICSFSMLKYKQSVRKRAKLVAKGEKPMNWGVVKMTCSAVVGYTSFCYIVNVMNKDYTFWDYCDLGLKAFFMAFPFILRKLYVVPQSRLMQNYCHLYEVVMDPPLRNHIFLLLIVVAGSSNPIFYSMALLDILTMSSALKGVLRAVILPANELSQTLFLFVIVICIYTALAYYTFGSLAFGNLDDDAPDDAYLDKYCTSLMSCFIYTLYVGIRSSDMAEVLKDYTDYDSYGAEDKTGTRVIYDLSFFLILGVLLFNMVSGIILDKFSQIRGEEEEKADMIQNEAFVSGLSRASYEENGPDFNFDELNEKHQNMWNYFFYIVYIGDKDPSSYNGCESFVADCLEKNDISWLPTKTSWKLENSGGSREKSMEDWLEEIVKKVEGIERKIGEEDEEGGE